MSDYNGILQDIEQSSQLVCNHERFKIAYAILREVKKNRGTMLSGFELYYKVILLKTMRYWNGDMKKQWNYIKMYVLYKEWIKTTYLINNSGKIGWYKCKKLSLDHWTYEKWAKIFKKLRGKNRNHKATKKISDLLQYLNQWCV